MNRRAVKHLYENIRKCQKAYFQGGLTQEHLALSLNQAVLPRLGYLYVAEQQVLLLYDTSAHPGVEFKTLRPAMVAAVQKDLGRPERNRMRRGLELVIKSTTMIQANWRGKVRRRMWGPCQAWK